MFSKPPTRLRAKMWWNYQAWWSCHQNALLARLLDFGASAAKAGEFSARAFENGKMDLVQAEAIADLIDATHRRQRSAVRSLQVHSQPKLIRF